MVNDKILNSILLYDGYHTRPKAQRGEHMCYCIIRARARYNLLPPICRHEYRVNSVAGYWLPRKGYLCPLCCSNPLRLNGATICRNQVWPWQHRPGLPATQYQLTDDDDAHCTQDKCRPLPARLARGPQ